jgi:hypothetical protein
MTNKTVEYKLQSGTEDKVNIPENGIHEAEKIMKMIAQSKSKDSLLRSISRSGYFDNMDPPIKSDVMIKANYLRKAGPGNKRALKLQDDIYLILGCYELMKSYGYSAHGGVANIPEEDDIVFRTLASNFLERRGKE